MNAAARRLLTDYIESASVQRHRFTHNRRQRAARNDASHDRGHIHVPVQSVYYREPFNYSLLYERSI